MTGMKCLLGVAVLLAMSLVGAAAPVPAAKPNADKWEYCEIQSSYTITRVQPANPPAGGGAVPARVQIVRKTAIRFIAPDGEEIETESWDDLATKLKAPAAKGKPSAGAQKLRVFNLLGQRGWELAGQGRETNPVADVWTFKRKAAK